PSSPPSLLRRRPPSSPPFPSTTLFRSGYVLAAADGFRLAGPDGASEAGPWRPAGMPDGVRFNDGACDPAGRFWAGTVADDVRPGDRKSTRLNSSHVKISYAGFCLKKKK